MSGKEKAKPRKNAPKAENPPAKNPLGPKRPRPALAGRPTDAAAPLAPMATCLDQKSGLYHSQHFELTLGNEFRRMERTDKPLGLILVRFSGAKDADYQNLAAYLKNSLRPLDLAARLTGGEVAILIPEADRDRAVKFLTALGREYGPNGKLSGPPVAFGASLARPFQAGGPDELVQAARDNVGPAQEVAQRLLSGASPWNEVDTALAGPERDSLFNGFGSLSLAAGRRP
ncbi:MAG: GGDEF domain-containing protein [Deltaproteobacteria bacterium]|nr:GGDEF domain-containing protein [Deltaproteobacteria bacterium]